MRRFWAPAAAAAFALAFAAGCTGSGGGCAGGSSNANSGQSTPMGGGGGGASRGALTETVSFQGLGRKTPPPTTRAAASAESPAAAPGAAKAAAASAPDVTGGSQSLLCGGFPDLPSDCKTSPLFKAIKRKCCPKGTVERCQAIPGGARLIGRGCRPSAAP